MLLLLLLFVYLKPLSHFLEHHACEANEFRCLNGLCIPLKFQCDGESDCDEKRIHNHTVSSDEDPVQCGKCWTPVQSERSFEISPFFIIISFSRD